LQDESQGCAITIEDIMFTNQRTSRQRKNGYFGCGLVVKKRALCGGLSKQAHTQGQEEGMQGQSSYNNQNFG
jgi:hypothetical protein